MRSPHPINPRDGHLNRSCPDGLHCLPRVAFPRGEPRRVHGPSARRHHAPSSPLPSITLAVCYRSVLHATQPRSGGLPASAWYSSRIANHEYPDGRGYLQNGNVHMEFPLRTFVQRNGLKLTEKLIYDSRNCYTDPVFKVWRCWSGWREIYSPFQYGDSPYPPYIQTSQNTTQCTTGNGGLYYTPQTWSNFIFTDGLGSSHLMNVQIDNSNVACTGNPDSNSGWAFDGTGYFMTVTLSGTNGPPDWTVWDKSGNLQGNGKDTNGNFLSSNDELNRPYMPGSMPSGGAGAQQWVGSTIQWVNIPAYTAFGGTEFNGTISVVSSITLPDNRLYQFTYDQGTTQGHYGQIIGMTLPTGGQVNFTYTNDDIGWLDG